MDKLMGSGTGHAIHHARCNVNFGLITSLMD
jgi:sterol desaturase/sphingolipid hydroxylase (fatty acid hydroxylase superfamily)